MQKRRHLKQTAPLQERLQAFAREVRAKAAGLPPSVERDELLRKARQADTATHFDEWASSPGLQPPK